MTSFSFTQHAGNWQQFFLRNRSGGFFSRLFAWLMLGLLMLTGLLVVVSVLLLGWLLIPVLLYKKRRAMEKMREAGMHTSASTCATSYTYLSTRDDVIDGVVHEVREDNEHTRQGRF